MGEVAINVQEHDRVDNTPNMLSKEQEYGSFDIIWHESILIIPFLL